jgi:hypothetical protein
MKLEMSGKFHQIAKFAYELGKVDRIINVENIELTDPKVVGDEVMLKGAAWPRRFTRSSPRGARRGAKPAQSRRKAPSVHASRVASRAGLCAVGLRHPDDDLAGPRRRRSAQRRPPRPVQPRACSGAQGAEYTENDFVESDHNRDPFRSFLVQKQR